MVWIWMNVWAVSLLAYDYGEDGIGVEISRRSRVFLISSINVIFTYASVQLEAIIFYNIYIFLAN